MSSRTRRPRPSSILLLLAGGGSPLRLFAMAAWILLLAFGAMCTFATLGAWTSLRASCRSLVRAGLRQGPPRRPRWG